MKSLFHQFKLFQSLIGRLKTGIILRSSGGIIGVSIPYRQAKNLPSLSTFYSLDHVSIPYRQAKNELLVSANWPGLHVSIPYRQAKNLFFGKRLISQICMFQSLIGRLKTLKVPTHFIAHFPFQSLIGRLKTQQAFQKAFGEEGCFNPLQVG